MINPLLIKILKVAYAIGKVYATNEIEKALNRESPRRRPIKRIKKRGAK